MKKGFTMPEFIVTIIGVIVVFMLFTALFAKIDLWSLRENCRISSWAGAKGSEYSFTGQSAISLNCPRYKVNFLEGKTEIKEIKSNKKKYLDEAKDEGDYYRVMAEEMRGCWYQFNEGKVDVFDKEFYATTDSATHCFYCDELKFEKEIPQTLNYENLNKFLQDKKMKNSDSTYWEFLSNSNPELSQIEYYEFITNILYDNNFLKNQFFDKNEKYVIVFIKKGNNVEWPGFVFIPDLFTDMRTFLGTYIVPSTEVGKLCQQIIT